MADRWENYRKLYQERTRQQRLEEGRQESDLDDRLEEGYGMLGEDDDITDVNFNYDDLEKGKTQQPKSK